MARRLLAEIRQVDEVCRHVEARQTLRGQREGIAVEDLVADDPVAGLQQAARKTVMAHRVQRRGAERSHGFDAVRHGARQQAVEVADEQVVGMRVIGREHARIGSLEE